MSSSAGGNMEEVVEQQQQLDCGGGGGGSSNPRRVRRVQVPTAAVCLRLRARALLRGVAAPAVRRRASRLRHQQRHQAAPGSYH